MNAQQTLNSGASPTWHEPRQARSRLRFEQILHSAATLFVAQGYDTVTTNHIAEAAAVPIGSLYQFFPNKESILAALLHRYTEQIRQQFAAVAPEGMPMAQVVGLLVDGLMLPDLRDRTYVRLFSTLDGKAAAAHQASIHALLLGGIEAVLTHYYPQMLPLQRQRCAQTSLAIVKGLLHLLPIDGEATLYQAYADEAKIAIIAYVQAVATRA